MTRVTAVLAVSLMLLGCSSATPCEAGSCTGCCDSAGTCRPGTLNSQCGAASAACSACADSQSCVSQSCGLPLGGGSGGGSATGGGGGFNFEDAGCAVMPWVGSSVGAGGYSAALPQRPAHNVGLQSMANSDGGASVLTVELWYFGENESAVVPWPVTLRPTTAQACSTCIYLEENCTPTGTNCERLYLAQLGAVSFTTATRDINVGELAVTGTGVTLFEWSLVTDAPTRGRCVTLSFGIDATWDAGLPDGGAGDGG